MRSDESYSGKRVPTKGSGPDCPADDNVSPNIHGAVLSFTNRALRNFGIGFYPQRDRSFHLTYTDNRGDIVNILRHVNGDIIEADVTNPPCEYHWHLKKE
jgi:hypothetical protein